MKIIFAQGNPGTEFARTRHNVGFMLLDMYATKQKVEFVEKTKFQCYVADLTIDGEKVLLVKPTTYYNDTGIAARALVDFYKLNASSDLLVIHDDLALPFGTVRTREKGSDAGNNGIKSLNAHLDQGYARIRVGIWNELSDKMEATAFVLGKFTKDEQQKINSDTATVAYDIISNFIRGSFATTSYTISKDA